MLVSQLFEVVDRLMVRVDCVYTSARSFFISYMAGNIDGGMYAGKHTHRHTPTHTQTHTHLLVFRPWESGMRCMVE